MPNYCLVEGGVVVDGPRALYKNWRNVSGLDKMPAEELKVLGWLPHSETPPVYDPATQYLDNYSIDIQADQVVYSAIVKDFTVSQLAQNATNDFKTKMFNSDNLETGVPRIIEDILDLVLTIDSTAMDDVKYDTTRIKLTDKKNLRLTDPDA